MDRFIMQHRDLIVGTLSCFDRVLFKGHLPINYAQGLDIFITRLGPVALPSLARAREADPESADVERWPMAPFHR